MKRFESISLRLQQCSDELAEFRFLLDQKSDLDEVEDILPFFKSHKMLSALIGTLIPDISKFVVAHEFPLMGSIVCDLVVGDQQERNFVFVEFENADPNSLFWKRGRQLPEWGPRLEHAFGQVVDWFFLIDDMGGTKQLQSAFGVDSVRPHGLIIAGRSSYLDSTAESRLRWRMDKVIVNSQRILCLTFDQLHDRLMQKLALLSVT